MFVRDEPPDTSLNWDTPVNEVACTSKMKFIVALSLFTCLTSAAFVDPNAEPSSSNVVNPVAPEAVVETLPSEAGDLNDLLGKIKTAVGQGLAGAEVGGDSTDPFAGIFQKDFAKMFPELKLPDAEKIKEMKKMFGSDDDFKKILDSDAHGKLFDENLVKSLFEGTEKLNSGDAQTVHKNIDKAFADLLGLSPELIEENRKKAMEKLEEIHQKRGDSNFGWDDFFGHDFAQFLNGEL